MRDAVRDLSHDHGELNRRVVAIAARLHDAGVDIARLATSLGELREALFTHFAREEEGLFPFVSERVPELAPRVEEMATTHDTICGALSRACHLASSGAERSLLLAVYDRFERGYAEHARAESELLAALALQLDAVERDHLASLVEGL